jgi:RimJ/RimL family protein N-acetyltransferase
MEISHLAGLKGIPQARHRCSCKRNLSRVHARDHCKNGTDLIFAILDKQTKEFLGVCGLHGAKNPREPELGVWLKKSVHGKGLGREAINVLRRWSERMLSVDGFIYPVDRRNLPSRKIPEALGGVVAGERRVQNMSGIELDELIYRIPVALDHL